MKILKIILAFLLLIFVQPSLAYAQNSYASVVNPVRGNDFWDLKDQSVNTAVVGEMEILKRYSIPATWLIRYDALSVEDTISKLKDSSDEKGLFLEITPSWTKDAGVSYHVGETWHSAGSAFLTGYETSEREKLIDTSFEKFKSVFGNYPKSVGAWWIDAYSLNYMQKKYAVASALIVADQYTTDNYQIWGQYFSTPYYPSKTNILHPAQNTDEKLPVVVVQWASRDPVNSYGNGVGESTYSVQANDYIDYHSLDTNYFSKLVSIYTNQPLDNFGQIVVGLENSYSWDKYSKEYENQIKLVNDLRIKGQLTAMTLSNFSTWYKDNFPNISPEHIIVADDPLGSYKKVVWFMNPFYRIGWFLNQDGSVIRDIRQYINGSEEPCFTKRCDSVNFATDATRVLDEVSFGHKWVIDQGKITDFKVSKIGSNYVISYKNEAGNTRVIKLLPRDISVNDKVQSIDTAILEATKVDDKNHLQKLQLGLPKAEFLPVLFNIIKFAVFFVFAFLVPGLILTRNINKSSFQKFFLASIIGLVFLTLIFYLVSILKMKPLLYVYIFVNVVLFLKLKLFNLKSTLKDLQSIGLFWGVIIAGTIFQTIPTFKSGLEFPYGLGFWGPNTHDGVWHISLINQLVKQVPPENPIYSGLILKNYHYFYDLLIAGANYLTAISIPDLLFRYFPVLFSLSLGIGSFYLVQNLFKNKVATFFSLYLIYFAGSFGWIVEFIKQRHLGGESAFWVNQAISFNLNPPFAISLIIIIVLLQLLPLTEKLTKMTFLINSVLIGCLIAFKSYGGVLILGTVFIIGVWNLIRKKDLSFLSCFIGGGIISAGLFLSNFEASRPLLMVAPFWFVNSMIDSPDRVGWTRLSLMRMVGQSQGPYLKFIAAETISLLIFIFGNLGLRFLSFGVFFRLKKVANNSTFIFITVFSFLSALIPTIFIQAGNPWNTIQFIYYYLYTAALFSGVVIAYILSRVPKIIGLIIILIVLILSPINSIVTASGYIPSNPHAFISEKEIEALKFLSNQSDGTVLTYPYNEKLKNEIAEPWPLLAYDSTAYVSAFSKKISFLEDISQNQILLTDYKKRLVIASDFFLSPEAQQLKILEENRLKYIYIPKVFQVSLDETNQIKKIFENEEVLIYKRSVSK